MKNTFFKSLLFLTLAVFFFVACGEDDSDPTPVDGVNLKFNKETAQDQMGDFADNAMAYYDGKIYSVSGDNSYTPPFVYTDAVWNSLNGINWVSQTSDMFAGRRGHTLTNYNANMWLIGGYDNSNNIIESTHYSPDGDVWMENLVPFGTGLGYHSTFIFGTKLYVYARHQGIWSSVNGFDWVLETANPFPVRSRQQAVVLDGTVYILGGNVDGVGLTNEIWKSNDGVNWSLVTPTTDVFSPRDYFTVTVYHDKIWVINGSDTAGDPIGDIWYSGNGENWEKYDEIFPISARNSHVVLNYNDALWVFGGRTNLGISGEIWTIKEIL